MKPADMARKFNCSPAAISQRLKQLNLTTASAAVAPAESQRFIRHNLGVMEQLSKNLVRANLLMDACDEWLRDAEDPTKYDVGARTEEVQVTWIDYSGEKPAKRKNNFKFDPAIGDEGFSKANELANAVVTELIGDIAPLLFGRHQVAVAQAA